MFDPNPFTDASSLHPADMAADAVYDLLRAGGPEVIAMSSVARWLNVTPSALHHQYGGRGPFLEKVVGAFADRWVRWICTPEWRRVIPIRLPATADEVHGVRVWHTMCSLAAGEERAGRPGLAAMVRAAESDERAHVAGAIWRARGSPVTDQELEVSLALGSWLRQRMAAADDALSEERARSVLRAHFTETLGLVPEQED